MARRIEWTPQGRGDLRRIDRQTAMDLLEGLADHLRTGYGDVERWERVGSGQFPDGASPDCGGRHRCSKHAKASAQPHAIPAAALV
jgi:hypothetical protein